jgi:hypothetical protein
MHWRIGVAEDPAERDTQRGFTNGSPAELNAGRIDDVVLPQAMPIVRVSTWRPLRLRVALKCRITGTAGRPTKATPTSSDCTER